MLPLLQLILPLPPEPMRDGNPAYFECCNNTPLSRSWAFPMTRAKPKATAPASGRALVRRSCSRAAASSQAPGTNRGRSPATNSDDDSPLGLGFRV